MEEYPLSRRHLLRYGALGLTTALAGCNTTNNPADETNHVPDDGDTGTTAEPPDGTDDEPDGPSHEIPEQPPIAFQAPTANPTYYDLPIHEELPDPTDLGKLPELQRMHPDNRAFDLTITKNEATLDITTQVRRAVIFTLHVRDANHDFQTATARIEPTTTNDWTDHTLTFDLSDITLPREAGGFAELTMDDSHAGNPHTVLCKRHHFVGIPHKNGTEWVNHEVLNPKRYTNDKDLTHVEPPSGVYFDRANDTAFWPSRVETPAGYMKHIDGEDERTVILATRTQQGEAYGVSAHIEHDSAQRFKDAKNDDQDTYSWKYGYKYELNYATEIDPLTELAEKTDRAITGLGITNTNPRLEALGDLIQMINYVLEPNDARPSVVLYNSYGDCSSKSILMAAILQHDQWRTRCGYIDCKLNGERHWTIGLDVRDIDNLPDDAYTVAPSDEKVSEGYDDTEYALWDMTYNSSIGQRSSSLSGPFTIYDEGDFEHNPGNPADDPPDY